MSTSHHTRQRIAFLTMTVPPDSDLPNGSWYMHDDLLVPVLQRRGWEVDPHVSWRAYRHADWTQYHAVIARSTWDYQDNLQEFFTALEHIVTTAPNLTIFNSLEVMKWNASKMYLRQLAVEGQCPIIPSAFWGSRASRDGFCSFGSALYKSRDQRILAQLEEVVIKPVVSASSFDTFRLQRSEIMPVVFELRKASTPFSVPVQDPHVFPSRLEFLAAVFANRGCIVQPLVESIGEQR